MGALILSVIGIALVAAVIAMLVSGTASDMTLATTKFDQSGDNHH